METNGLGPKKRKQPGLKNYSVLAGPKRALAQILFFSLTILKNNCSFFTLSLT